MEFPKEEITYGQDNEYIIGDETLFDLISPYMKCYTLVFLKLVIIFPTGGALLACPVTDQGAQAIKVFLPGLDEVQ